MLTIKTMQTDVLHTTTYSALLCGVGAPVDLLVRVTGISDSEAADLTAEQAAAAEAAAEIARAAGKDPEAARRSILRDACHRLRLRDFGDTRDINTLPVCDIPLTERAHHAMRAGTRVVATGRYVPFGRRRRREGGDPLLFQLDSLREVQSACELLGATREEVADADDLIAHLVATPDGLYQHLVTEFYDLDGLHPDAFSSRHLQLQRLTVLQALSAGQVNASVNPRLSTYFISDSGAGKKSLARLARFLNPVDEKAEPHNFSGPGLTARVDHKEGQWRTEPGALPRASGGVFIMEDLHRVPDNQVNLVQGAALTVLEDGQVCPVKAARASYDAKCAMHLNANFEGALTGGGRGSGAEERLQDLPLLSMDVLSRVDVVAALVDDEDPAALARAIATQPDGAPRDRAVDGPRLRALRVLVARLIDRAPSVDLSPVEEQIGALMDDLTLVLRDVTANLTGPQRRTLDPDGLLKRMANTVRKLAGASARLSGRTVAEAGDVVCAGEMVQLKLEIIRYVCSDEGEVRQMGRLGVMVERAERRRELRFQKLLETYGGQGPRTLEDLAGAMDCSAKTLRRELSQRGIEPQDGVYHLPTWARWELEEAQRRWRKERGMPPEPQKPVEQPVEIGPDGRPLFADGIRPMGAAILPFVAALGALLEKHEGRREWAAEKLCGIAFGGTAEEAQATGQLLWALIADETPMLNGRVYREEFLTKLVAADPVERGRFALECYVQSDLPDISSELSWNLRQKGAGMPPPLRELLEKVNKRLAWYRGRGQSRMSRRLL